MIAAVRKLSLRMAVRREQCDFRRALRNYRRHVRPMADPAHSLLDSWYFLIPIALMCVGILLARAWGYLP